MTLPGVNARSSPIGRRVRPISTVTSICTLINGSIRLTSILRSTILPDVLAAAAGAAGAAAAGAGSGAGSDANSISPPTGIPRIVSGTAMSGATLGVPEASVGSPTVTPMARPASVKAGPREFSISATVPSSAVTSWVNVIIRLPATAPSTVATMVTAAWDMGIALASAEA